jgi:hypothetical protein
MFDGLHSSMKKYYARTPFCVQPPVNNQRGVLKMSSTDHEANRPGRSQPTRQPFCSTPEGNDESNCET